MLLWISWFIGSFISIFGVCYIFSSVILKRKMKFNYLSIIPMIVYSISNSCMTMFGVRSLRVLISFIMIFLCLYIIYKQKTAKTLISTFLIYLLFGISEMIYAFIFVNLLNLDPLLTERNCLCIVLTNVSILIICVVICKIKPINKIVNSCVNWYSSKKTLNIIIITVISIFSIFVFMNRNMTSTLPIESYVINILVCIYIIVMSIAIFKEMTDKNKVSFDYDQLLTYVKAYENMTEQKNKNQHEHNNQLSYIRGMVEAKDPDNEIISYIDNLLDNQKNTEDEKLLKELRFLPGGLKGFIHYKITKMKDEKIDVTVYVSDELKKKGNWELYKKFESEISHILGVYLDNAKDAAKEAKQKYVVIDMMYEDGNLLFSISNTYTGTINLDKMDKAKYSTKGTGRGYGLSVVKDIIDKSSHIEQSREIRGMYFIQNLTIKK